MVRQLFEILFTSAFKVVANKIIQRLKRIFLGFWLHLPTFNHAFHLLFWEAGIAGELPSECRATENGGCSGDCSKERFNCMSLHRLRGWTLAGEYTICEGVVLNPKRVSFYLLQVRKEFR